MFNLLYLAFLCLNATLFFGRGCCAKFHVLSQLTLFLVLFYPSLQLVYFVIFMFIANSLTSIHVLLVVF